MADGIVKWGITGKTSPRETFETKAEAVKAMMGKRAPKTPIERSGREYLYQEKKN